MWSPTHVQVTVQRARNLPHKGKKGTNDAFVLIQMGKEKFQTTVKERTAQPEWYEECDLTLIGRDSDVRLTVCHRNALGLDEFLGQVSVPLQVLESLDRPFAKWYPLKGKTDKSEEKYRGDIEVRLAYVVRRSNDTQSLTDLSFKKKKHSIKHLAATMGHHLQKFPSRSMSLRNLDPRKRLEKLKEHRVVNSQEEEDEEETECPEFEQVPMKRHGPAYSSTLSLPQSALITTSIREAESLEEMPDNLLANSPPPKPSPIKLIPNGTETRILNRGEWTNRLLNSKGSPIARSETNLIEALRSESPIVPTRKSKFDTFRHNLRRHTLQLSDPPNLLPLQSRTTDNTTPDGIPDPIMQQYEKMDTKELILLAIRQQGDLERQRDKILDLENYLDNLLVRVMETTPRILQKTFRSPESCRR